MKSLLKLCIQEVVILLELQEEPLYIVWQSLVFVQNLSEKNDVFICDKERFVYKSDWKGTLIFSYFFFCCKLRVLTKTWDGRTVWDGKVIYTNLLKYAGRDSVNK